MIVKKPLGRSRVYDVLHRSGVNICIGTSLIAGAYLAYYGINLYMRVSKSQANKEKEAAIQEKELGFQKL